MDLSSLIKIKLERELLSEFNKYYESISERVSQEEYILFIKSRIKDKISENEIMINTNEKNIIIRDNQCCARIMGPRYSDLRCTHKTHENIDYCKKHLERINEYGYLAFSRYDQERPIINEKGNKIPWRDSSATEDIDTIIQYQLMNLKKLIQ